jgi:uncharacterized protein (TIGR04255 family)
MTHAVGRGAPYDKPPIQEGFCQFNFVHPLPWNPATPGVLWTELKDKYPAPPEQRNEVQAQFAPAPGDPNAAQGISFGSPEARFLYKSEDLTRLVVANERFLSANSLKPYEGWPKLSQRLAEAMDILRRHMGGKLPNISKIAIRYVNTIVVPVVEFDTDDYFRFPVKTAMEGSAAFKSIFVRIESSIVESEIDVLTTFATVNDASGPAFLLDIEVAKDSPVDGWTADEALEMANQLKKVENAEFESLITEKTRRLFN